jgi:predicted  nucleic acid-binding Zn-ribbon protein
MINNQSVEEKIKGLQAEVASLESIHNAMVENFKKQDEQFRQAVQNNQNKWQQLTGAITELKKMLDPGLKVLPNHEPMTLPKRNRHEHKSRRTTV